MSAIVVMVVWKLGGQSVYDHARAGMALTSEEGLTYQVALETLVGPAVAGFLLGELTDVIAAKAASILAGSRSAGSEKPRVHMTASPPVGTRFIGFVLDAPPG